MRIMPIFWNHIARVKLRGSHLLVRVEMPIAQALISNASSFMAVLAHLHATGFLTDLL